MRQTHKIITNYLGNKVCVMLKECLLSTEKWNILTNFLKNINDFHEQENLWTIRAKRDLRAHLVQASFKDRKSSKFLEKYITHYSSLG